MTENEEKVVSNLMTVSEVADLFRCSTKTIYRWISKGHIPESTVIRIGPRTLRIDRREINQAISSSGELRRWSSRAA